MRLEGFVLSALVIAASAVIFGDLGRAAAPNQVQPGENQDVGTYPAAGAQVAGVAADACAGPRTTALRFLDQGVYASDADPGCPPR
ncbi:hypothetical protein V5F77_10885 [Xanthobacter sp. DSM 24535]|uniref:hypothetical protein n=1 Tax=Roseixanthobacter psychrophilus TaxID=3119917 RepID=UPI00372BBBBA